MSILRLGDGEQATFTLNPGESVSFCNGQIIVKHSPQNKEKNPITDNIFYKFQNHIFLDGETKIQDVETKNMIEQTQTLIEKILNNQKDINLLFYGKKLEKVSKEFENTFLYLMFLQICIWNEGSKSERKKLMKIKKTLTESDTFNDKKIGEYLNFLAQDTQNYSKGEKSEFKNEIYDTQQIEINY